MMMMMMITVLSIAVWLWFEMMKYFLASNIAISRRNGCGAAQGTKLCKSSACLRPVRIRAYSPMQRKPITWKFPDGWATFTWWSHERVFFKWHTGWNDWLCISFPDLSIVKQFERAIQVERLSTLQFSKQEWNRSTLTLFNQLWDKQLRMFCN